MVQPWSEVAWRISSGTSVTWCGFTVSTSSTKRASKRYGVPSVEILKELGRRKTVGGQEDMIEDVALDMQRAMREQAESDAAPDATRRGEHARESA